MTDSCLRGLECSYCGAAYNAEVPHRTCESCGKVLFARYDLDHAARLMTKEGLKGRQANMWRYREIMPVHLPEHVITLGEGFTPILPSRRLGRELGLSNLFIKDEALNPTGSFKARGLSAAVSRAKELGIKRLTMPSAGNAAGAMAAYAAAAGLEANVFMPKDAPDANRIESQAFGARLELVDGFITDAGKLSSTAAAERDLFDVSTLREPNRAEGKKTMGLEIAEQFAWSLPDVIVYPTGGGTGIVGMWKAFAELEEMGWIGPERPRMVVVQAEGCAPIVKAFEAGEEFATPVESPSTVAAGMRVPSAIGDYLILQAVRVSGGTAVSVTDEELLEGVKDLSRWEGMLAAPEGGATLAGLRKLLAAGEVQPQERILLINTGSGLKYLDVLRPLWATPDA